MDPSRATARRARQLGDHGRALLGVLGRLVPLARGLVRGIWLLAVASGASIVVMAAVVLAHGVPSLPVAAALVVIVAVLAPAPVVLWLFHDALVEVIALPEWLRSSPDVAAEHGAELAALVRSSREPPVRRGRLVRDTVRAGRLLLAAHRDLPGYGAVLRLMSPAFLVAVVVALGAALFEVGLAATVVVLDVTLRLLG